MPLIFEYLFSLKTNEKLTSLSIIHVLHVPIDDVYCSNVTTSFLYIILFATKNAQNNQKPNIAVLLVYLIYLFRKILKRIVLRMPDTS